MKENRTIPVRLSHLLRHSSVGAIVRSAGDPSYMMVVEDIRHWVNPQGDADGELIPYVEGVKGSLGIKEDLRRPPVARLGKDGSVDGTCIPARIFPSWMQCPECKFLFNQPWRGLDDGRAPVCSLCRSGMRIDQVTWVMAHESGYLADVPWHFIAHRDARNMEQKNCRHDWTTPYLRLVDEAAGRGYRILCARCGAYGSFDASTRVSFGNTPCQPWPDCERADLPDGAELGIILQVNDARIHNPVTFGVLVIPPESRIGRGTVVDRLYSSSEWRSRLSRVGTALQQKTSRCQAAAAFACSVADIEEALAEIDNGFPLYGAAPTTTDLLMGEWNALVSEIPDNREDEDLVTEHHSEEWRSLAECIEPRSTAARSVAVVDHLVAIRRLKEIQVFKGFSRMGGEEIVPPDILGQTDWLPAIELFGEGIFVTFDEAHLSRWEQNPAVQARTKALRQRFVRSNRTFHPEIRVTPRFLLLHTLSHLLIRELEAHAGYPAASLKERIYASSVTELPMAGLMIYVAVPDVAGSLGGLADLAEPKRFLRLLSNAFDRARWCSLDPVCSEHDGQGPDLLNRAACHGCALIPEPSCVCGNLLLDRFYIKGGSDEDAGMMPAFLDFIPSAPGHTP